MNASQISCFFSLGFFDSTTQRLPLEGTPSEPVGQVFSNISWVRLKKNHKSNHPWPLCQAWPRWHSRSLWCFIQEPAWLPRHCWDQRFFHPGNAQLTATNSTRPWVKSHPRYPRLYDHADVSATFQGATKRRGGVWQPCAFGDLVWPEFCFLPAAAWTRVPGMFSYFASQQVATKQSKAQNQRLRPIFFTWRQWIGMHGTQASHWHPSTLSTLHIFFYLTFAHITYLTYHYINHI